MKANPKKAAILLVILLAVCFSSLAVADVIQSKAWIYVSERS